MRGIYSMGALASLEDAGLRDSFAVVVGTSAGAIDCAYFLTGQTHEALNLYAEELSTRRFVNRWRLNKIVDIDYLVDVVMKQKLPLNLEALRKSGTLLEVVLANAETGEEEIITNRDLRYDFYEVIVRPPPFQGSTTRRSGLATACTSMAGPSMVSLWRMRSRRVLTRYWRSSPEVPATGSATRAPSTGRLPEPWPTGSQRPLLAV